MGTFHDDRGELHGMTVVVDTKGLEVYVGRCDTLDELRVTLQDADVHESGQGRKSKDEYLQRAKKFGVWSRHPRLSIPMSQVSSVQLLARYGSGDAPVAAGGNGGAGTARPEPPVESAALTVNGEEALVQLSDSAKAEVRRLLGEAANAGKGLRLRVVGGGCSGLSYKLDFDEEGEKDFVVDCEDFSVFVDRKSAVYLRDVILDYQSGLEGRGFVFRNPNASNTCGCGESFSI